MKSKEPAVYHTPNWHPKLQAILGDIRGQACYITKYGTVELLGPIWEKPEIASTTYKTKDNGPTLLLTAQSSGGII